MPTHRNSAVALAIVFLAVCTDRPAAGAACTIQQLTNVLSDYIEFGSTSQTCDWRARFAPDFQPWNVGGSENRPLVAAAIKLFADGDAAAQIWWLDYLENQLGDKDDASLPLKVRRFHSAELFSSGYDSFSTRAVAAAHLWARDNGASTIQSLSRRWLRATWYTYALGAGRFKVEKLWSIRSTTLERVVPENANTYVQIASPRSVDEGWPQSVPILARAREIAIKYENNETKRLGNLLKSSWGSNVNPNVYGLDSTDRTNINSIVNSASFSEATLLSVYGNLRLYRNLHFFAFSQGQYGSRMSVLEPDGANYNHERIIFAVRFDNDTATGWLLAPWNNDTTTLGSCSYNLTTRQVTATGDFTRTLDMPSGTILYHVKLGTTGVSVPIP